jgi:hypothetical protein
MDAPASSDHSAAEDTKRATFEPRLNIGQKRLGVSSALAAMRSRMKQAAERESK